jgi:hypothetical protein
LEGASGGSENRDAQIVSIVLNIVITTSYGYKNEPGKICKQWIRRRPLLIAPSALRSTDGAGNVSELSNVATVLAPLSLAASSRRSVAAAKFGHAQG